METLDILYLTHNRLEFTKATFKALLNNTAWHKVDRFFWYDDDSSDGTAEYAQHAYGHVPVKSQLNSGSFGGPVAIMNDYLKDSKADIFAKVDSDTLLPPNWLTECTNVMDRHPELDLLGIEVFAAIVAGKCRRSYRTTDHIGGIGLMRTRAFQLSRPVPEKIRYGFTNWQGDRGDVNKGWLSPAVPVVLLDLLPMEPWRGLSESYIKQGWQRPWPQYHNRHPLWPYLEEHTSTYEMDITRGLYESADSRKVTNA